MEIQKINREQILREVLALNDKFLCLELATGVGKSRLAIEYMAKFNPASILIVIPRLVLIDNFKEEFIKWGKQDYMDKLTFVTYVSFPKLDVSQFDFVIFDESHHISQRCFTHLEESSMKRAIFLSATLSNQFKFALKQAVGSDINFLKIDIREAVDNEILAEPRVFLVPLSLDNTKAVHTIVEHPKAKIIKECLYKDRWQYLRDKNVQVHIKCTEFQYVNELGSKIDFWKKKYMVTRNEGVKTKWLFLAGQRLKFLSQIKNPILIPLLERLKSQRVLTFCSSIEQTEILGKNCINSKNKEASIILEKFNDKKIDHITACNMLNEGMNLVDCRIGLYANLNSSEIIIKQRLGRILRHKDPVIIIPYFQGTREEELVEKMLEDYNPELVTTTDINNIKL